MLFCTTRLRFACQKKWAPWKIQDAHSIQGLNLNPCVIVASRSASAFLPALFCSGLAGAGCGCCGCAADRVSRRLRRAELRMLARRRSQRPLSWFIPFGLWPIVRLRCRRTTWLRLSCRRSGSTPASGSALFGWFCFDRVGERLRLRLTTWQQADRSEQHYSPDARPACWPEAELPRDSPERCMESPLVSRGRRRGR